MVTRVVGSVLSSFLALGISCGQAFAAAPPAGSPSGNPPPSVKDQERTSEVIALPSDFRVGRTVRSLLDEVADDLKYVEQDGKILLIGTPDDIRLARKVVDAAKSGDIQDTTPEKLAQVVSLGYLRPEDAVRLLNQVLPGLEVNCATPNSAMTVSSPGPFASGNKSLTTLLTADTSTGEVVGVIAPDQEYSTGYRTPSLLHSDSPSNANKMMDDGAALSAMTGNTLVLVGTEQQLGVARTLLRQIDTPPAQVVVEARMLELSPETSERLGISWADIGGVLASTTIKEDQEQNGVRFGRFSRSPIEIQATLSALVRNGQARILASPTVSVLNGQEATIFVGDQLKYLAAQSLDENGRPLFTLANQDVGVNLVVKPSVNLKDNTVTLKLVPSISTFVQFVEAPGGGTLPQVRTRLVDTTVRLKDGELLAIGGLISDQDVVSMQKIPLLGDLPVLGQFFRQRRKEHTRTELAILIRPRIVRDSESLPATPFTENLSAESVKPVADLTAASKPATDAGKTAE